jgi:hypothetical protein
VSQHGGHSKHRCALRWWRRTAGAAGTAARAHGFGRVGHPDGRAYGGRWAWAWAWARRGMEGEMRRVKSACGDAGGAACIGVGWVGAGAGASRLHRQTTVVNAPLTRFGRCPLWLGRLVRQTTTRREARRMYSARQRRGRTTQPAKACVCESSGSARRLHSLRQRLMRRWRWRPGWLQMLSILLLQKDVQLVYRHLQ